MSRAAGLRYFLFLVLVLGLQGYLLMRSGLLMLTLHEGDALHLVEILFRMDAGQTPHIDFLTPIGIMAFAPIMLFFKMGVGKAVLASFVFMAAIALPAIWWAGYSRLRPALAYVFGAGCLVLFTAMVHGETIQVTSISMYYNRWAWAVAFVLVIVALLPSQTRPRPLIDGVVLGSGLAFLALTKMTFFVTFTPALALIVVLRGNWRTVGHTFGTGVFIAAVVTAISGFEFWFAYFDNLKIVGNGEVRTFPSNPLDVLLVGPRFLTANVVLLMGIVLLRQSGRSVEGVGLLCLAPVFVFVTYQNWGNDPKWLFLLGVILLSVLPTVADAKFFRWNLGPALTVTGLVAFSLTAPSALNMSLSALRHAKLDPADFSVILPGDDHDDLVVQTKLVYAPESRQRVSLSDPKMADLGRTSAELTDTALYDEPLKFCKVHRGWIGILHATNKELDALGYLAGKSIYVADLFSNYWLFGKSVPVKGGSPWYYGGDTGLANADYLLVPFCAETPQVRGWVMDELVKPDAPQFSEILRTDDYVLLEQVR